MEIAEVKDMKSKKQILLVVYVFLPLNFIFCKSARKQSKLFGIFLVYSYLSTVIRRNLIFSVAQFQTELIHTPHLYPRGD